ncbi:MAG: hypothetical protein IJY31_05660 [Muribaculaceae bacterium]|nr:hypothetical protein [Muribaculaceae bacterium]
MTKEGEFYSQLKDKLQSKGVTSEDIVFILNLIKDDSKDENLKVMNNDAFSKLQSKNLALQFEESCQELNIKWYHSNEKND